MPARPQAVPGARQARAGRRGLAFAAARAIVAAPFFGTARPAMRPQKRFQAKWMPVRAEKTRLHNGTARVCVSATPRRALAILMALGGTLALAACGVKGPLEPPPGAHVAAPPPQGAEAPAPTTSGYANSGTPHADWEKQKKSSGSGFNSGARSIQGVERPNQPFVLDGLL